MINCLQKYSTIEQKKRKNKQTKTETEVQSWGGGGDYHSMHMWSHAERTIWPIEITTNLSYLIVSIVPKYLTYWCMRNFGATSLKIKTPEATKSAIP